MMGYVGTDWQGLDYCFELWDFSLSLPRMLVRSGPPAWVMGTSKSSSRASKPPEPGASPSLVQKVKIDGPLPRQSVYFSVVCC